MLIKHVTVAVLWMAGAIAAPARAEDSQPKPVQHEYTIQNFRTEKGSALPKAVIV